LVKIENLFGKIRDSTEFN